MRPARPKLLAGTLVAFLVLVGAGFAVYRDRGPDTKRGSASEEFDASAAPGAKKATRKRIKIPWPTYGYDLQRTKVSPYDHRPPFRTKWRVDAGDTIEFPPSIGYGTVFIAQQKGKFFARKAKTGKPAFKTKDYKRCAASSPTIGPRHTLYQAYMHPVPCPQDAANPTGFVVAKDTRTGKEKWRFNAKPVESSPLLRGKRLYFGDWDGNVYALNARTGKKIWATQTGNKVNTSVAYSQGRLFVANDDGKVFAFSARSGKKLWEASAGGGLLGGSEFFYASPTVAYGRVFIGNTNGTMYAFGAKTGNTLWSRPLGSYIYGAAAVWQKKVYVGTYDGKFFALDAATGDTKWQRATQAAVHAPATVMDGLVYVATCGSCGSEASRAVKTSTRDSTTAFNARTGKTAWTNTSGKYANPIIADQDRAYLVGRSFLYALKPIGEKARKRAAKRKAGKRPGKRARRAARAKRKR